jgi:copper resistance protein B
LRSRSTAPVTRAARWRRGSWDAQAWYGGDYNKLWLKTEGERINGLTQDARVELLFDRVVARWWDAQAGVRQDFGQGPARTWLAVGLEGLAPYWLDAEATLYVGEQGRTAARLKADYDLLLTQRLVLQPYAEANLYGKSDPQRLIGSGLSDLELSLRLRYEIRRELAPYLGVVWSRSFGGTAELVRAAGETSDDVQFVAGVPLWF